MRGAAFFATFLATVAGTTPADELLVWPVPRQIELSADPWLAIAANITIAADASESPILARGVARFERLLQGQAVPSKQPIAQIQAIRVTILSSSEHLRLTTNYSYQLRVSASAATAVSITAASPFGALYALETFSQL